MSFINPNKIDTIEEYVFALGACAVSIETVYKLQQQALKKGILELDEREKAETVAYECARLFNSISDVLEMLSARINIQAGEIAKVVQDKFKPETNRNKRSRKKLDKQEVTGVNNACS